MLYIKQSTWCAALIPIKHSALPRALLASPLRLVLYFMYSTHGHALTNYTYWTVEYLAVLYNKYSTVSL